MDRQPVEVVGAGVSLSACVVVAADLEAGPGIVVAAEVGRESMIVGVSIAGKVGSCAGRSRIAVEASNRISRRWLDRCRFHHQPEAVFSRGRQQPLVRQGRQGCMPWALAVQVEM